MINEDDKNSGYRAYLVRMWPARNGGQMVWRASVEDARNGERRAFADLSHLFAFLQEAAVDNPAKFQNEEHPDD